MNTAKIPNFYIAEMKSNTPGGHDAQFDASEHNNKSWKLNTHNKQDECQRATSSASSEAFLNKSFYVESEPYNDLPGDNEDLVVGFKKTCKDIHLRGLLA